MPEPPVIGRRLIRLATTGSTMHDVAKLAERGEPEGVVVVAAEQTAGRGRAGRTWSAPAGSSILCSILLRPAVAPARLTVLPLVLGAGVAVALERTTGCPCQVKWPNDIWLNERKAAGILLAARTERDRVAAVILGIGVNVNPVEADLPPAATSLLAATGKWFDLNAVLENLLVELERVYADYVATGGQPSLAAWRERAALMDERVTVRDGEVEATGWMRGIGPAGELLLEVGPGEIRSIVAGDLTRGPGRA